MLISIAITACGGGGSLESPGGGSSDKYELTVTLASADSGDGISEVSKAVPGILVANLTKNGTVSTNQLITFAIGEQGIGVLNPTAGTAQTNNNGDAQINLFAGTVAGGGTVSASYTTADNDTVTVTHVFTSKGDDESDEDSEYKIALEMKNLQGEIISKLSPSEPGLLTAHLTKNNESVSNEIINFSSANNAVIDSSDSSEQLTDSNGMASKIIYVGEDNGASTVNVEFIIPGTSTLVTGKFNFESQGIGENNGYLLTLELRNQNGDLATELSPSNPVVGIASLTQNGQPVSDRKLSFENVEINEVITDENGQAISIFKQCINETNNCQTSGVASLEVLFSGDENSNGSLRTTKLITEKDEIPVYSYQTKLSDSSNDPVEIITNSDSFHFEVTVFKDGTLVGAGEIVRLETRFNNFPSMDNSNDRTFKEVATDSNGLIKAVIEATGNHADYVTVTIVTPGIIASSADIVVFNSEYTLLEDQFELDLSFENGLSNNTVSGASPAVLKAKLTKQGVVASNEVIRFAVNDAGLLEEPLKVVTDINGEASIVLNAGTDVGAGIAYATLEKDGLVNQVQDSLVFTSLGSELSVTAVLQNQAAQAISHLDHTQPGIIKLTVVKDGQPLANEKVVFNNIVNAKLDSSTSNEQITDASGQTQLVIYAGDLDGASSVEIEVYEGNTRQVTQLLNFTSTGVGQNEGYTINLALSGGEGNNTVSGANSGVVTATLFKDGQAVNSEVIQFSINGIGTLNPTSGTVATNSSGEAAIDLLAGETKGAGIVSATYITATDLTISSSLVFTSIGDGFVLAASLVDINDNPITTVSSSTRAFVKAELKQNNVSVNNQIISFDIDVTKTGSIEAINQSQVTDATGIAKSELLPGVTAGAGEVTVSFDNGKYTKVVNFISQGDEISVVLSEKNDSRNISHSVPATLVATLMQGGTPLSYKIVKFSSPDVGIINPTSGSAMTDVNGQAEITLLAGTVAGAGLAHVEYTADSGRLVNDDYAFSTAGDAPIGGNETGVNIDLILTTGANDSNLISTDVNKDNPLTAWATVSEFVNGSRESVANRVVTFSSTLGELNPSNGTALTDSNGIANIKLTAGSVAGAGEITATFSGTSVSTGYVTAGDVIIETGSVLIDLKLVSCPDNWDKNRSTMLESGNCVAVTNVDQGSSAIIYAKVTDKQSGDTKKNIIVTGSSTIGTVLPESGSALTDENGIALLNLLSGNDVGAGEVNITASDVTSSSAFEIGAAEVTVILSAAIGLNELAAGSTTLLTVEINDADGNDFTTPLEVQFTSGCAAATPKLAYIDSPVTSLGGTATSTYRADGCQDTDTITATVITGGDVAIAETQIKVSASDVGSLEFVSVSENVLALARTGRVSVSDVKFKLLDKNGNPVGQKTVEFSLSTSAGGITISPDEAQTDDDGLVQTTVNSGNVITPVVVRAKYVVDSGDTDLDIVSVSSQLNISTGLPTQDSFTLVPQHRNIEGLNHFNEKINLIVLAADGYSHPVPDGTSVMITAEGGSVGNFDGDGATPLFECLISGGECSVEWRSQNNIPFYYDENKPESVNYQNSIAAKCDTWFNNSAPCSYGIVDVNRTGGIADLDADNRRTYEKDSNGFNIIDRPLAGRVTVTAFTEGQEKFIDRNANGQFDAGEFWTSYDLPEVFYDHNENGIYENANGDINCDVDAGNGDPCSADNSNGGEFETHKDKISGDGYTVSNSKYNGLLCTADAEASGLCEKELIHVRDSTILTMSGSIGYARATVDVDENYVDEACNNYVITYEPDPTNAPGVTATATILELEPSDFDKSLETADYKGYCDVKSINLTGSLQEVNKPMLESINITIRMSDINNNPLPFGTIVSTSATNGELAGGGSFTIGSTSTRIPVKYAVTIGREGTGNKQQTGIIEVLFKTLKGQESGISLDVFDDR
jgi:hypothetical protein